WDHVAGLDVEVRLPCERRAGGRIHAARDLEVAEAPAERDLALVVQRPAAEDQHRVLLERRAHALPGRRVELACDVDAVDARGEYRSQSGHDDLAHRLLASSILAP